MAVGTEVPWSCHEVANCNDIEMRFKREGPSTVLLISAIDKYDSTVNLATPLTMQLFLDFHAFQSGLSIFLSSNNVVDPFFGDLGKIGNLTSAKNYDSLSA